MTTAHLMPTFARVDLAFERGEGAWLIATNGERYLDFTSGVAVNALGHAHPHLVAALTAQAAKALARLQPLPHSRAGAAGRPAVRRELRRPRLLRQFRRRGDRVRHQDRAQVSCGERSARSASASSPSRARSTAARLATLAAGGQKKYLDGFGPVVDGFDQVPFGDLEATKRAIGPADRRDPDRADAGRGRRARAAAAVPARACAQLCDEHGLLLIFDEVQSGHRPHRRAVRLPARRRRARHHGARQGARRRLPARRLPRHGRGRARA